MNKLITIIRSCEIIDCAKKLKLLHKLLRKNAKRFYNDVNALYLLLFQHVVD